MTAVPPAAQGAQPRRPAARGCERLYTTRPVSRASGVRARRRQAGRGDHATRQQLCMVGTPPACSAEDAQSRRPTVRGSERL